MKQTFKNPRVWTKLRKSPRISWYSFLPLCHQGSLQPSVQEVQPPGLPELPLAPLTQPCLPPSPSEGGRLSPRSLSEPRAVHNAIQCPRTRKTTLAGFGDLRGPIHRTASHDPGPVEIVSMDTHVWSTSSRPSRGKTKVEALPQLHLSQQGIWC